MDQGKKSKTPKLGRTFEELARSLSARFRFRGWSKTQPAQGLRLGRRVVLLDSDVQRYLAEATGWGKGEAMSPYKRGATNWFKFLFQGQLIRESAKTNSKTIVREVERARRSELELGCKRIVKRERVLPVRGRTERTACFEECIEDAGPCVLRAIRAKARWRVWEQTVLGRQDERRGSVSDEALRGGSFATNVEL